INIKTIILHKEGTPLTLPAINLNAGEKLELHFDDLSAQQRSFSYTLIHCNKEWEQSALEQQEYLDGYGSGRIEITSTSFNTTYNYFHHSIVFPVEEAYPRISGNYALVVYENDNPEDVVLVRQFYVHESLVTVEASCIQPSGEKYGTGQEIECSLNHEGYSIINPDSDITILIRQNMNSRSDIKITKPRFIGPATINYGGRNEIIFDGGNEFRYFDIKSMKYEAENITSIDFQKPYYHVFLKTGESRAFDPYFTQQDINGRFYIETEGSEDRHKEADYVVVHFSLSAQIPFTDGEVYITGALCEGFPEDDFRMSFNPDKRQYEKALLLKQGFYNYMFVYCPKGSETCDMGYLEGNHYETANEYVVFVYHYDSSWDYDRLIAIKQFRSK
ncbi:MAG: DUF5103 domain-containing protein, partial [Bacteroidales bacterium]|nr:DUF5103 domain-containing protein [Bacteroidales bacterium]